MRAGLLHVYVAANYTRSRTLGAVIDPWQRYILEVAENGSIKLATTTRIIINKTALVTLKQAN